MVKSFISLAANCNNDPLPDAEADQAYHGQQPGNPGERNLKISKDLLRYKYSGINLLEVIIIHWVEVVWHGEVVIILGQFSIPLF